MKVFEVTGSTLQYGDLVKMADENSKYHGKFGKIMHITNLSAKVLFKDHKKPISVMLNGLEKI